MMLIGRSAGVVPLVEEHVPFVVRAPPDCRATCRRETPGGTLATRHYYYYYYYYYYHRRVLFAFCRTSC